MKLKSAQLCLVRVILFLLFILFISFSLFEVLSSAFLYNIQINSVIIISLIMGIVYIFKRIFAYNLEYSKLLIIDILPKKELEKFDLLRPIIIYISKSNKVVSQQKLQSILSSVEKKINDKNALPKYLTGILIFLGLLGTFWGLSHTIGNVANIIDTLGIDQSSASDSFLKLKSSLKIPLMGMGIAFGCSLFGLSSSLILGFVNINQKRVADNFIDKVEEWLVSNTVSVEDEIDVGYHGNKFSNALLEKTIEMIYSFESQIKDIDNNKLVLYNIQKEMSQKISKLLEALLIHQDVIKTVAKNQSDIQGVISKQFSGLIFADISSKLDSIDNTLSFIAQLSLDNRTAIIDTLSKDIRMISKTLSTFQQ